MAAVDFTALQHGGDKQQQSPRGRSTAIECFAPVPLMASGAPGSMRQFLSEVEKLERASQSAGRTSPTSTALGEIEQGVIWLTERLTPHCPTRSPQCRTKRAPRPRRVRFIEICRSHDRNIGSHRRFVNMDFRKSRPRVFHRARAASPPGRFACDNSPALLMTFVARLSHNRREEQKPSTMQGEAMRRCLWDWAWHRGAADDCSAEAT